MTEPKFTPGPWRVEATDTTFTVVSADGIQVVRTSWHSHLRKPYPLKAEAFSNARLSSAAPQMYEALEKVAFHLRANPSPSLADKLIIDLCAATLSAATGGSDAGA
jgi:hypothetical protein